MARTVYDARECTVLVDGITITGLGEDMVSFSKDKENLEPRTGAQGDVCVNRVNDNLFTLTLRVQATCPQKGFLLQLANSGAIVPVWVTNKSIGERFGGNEAAVKAMPELEMGALASDREFVFSVFGGVMQNI